MQFNVLARPSDLPLQSRNHSVPSPPLHNYPCRRLRESRISFRHSSSRSPCTRPRLRLRTACLSPGQGVLGEKLELETAGIGNAEVASVSFSEEEEEEEEAEAAVATNREEFGADLSILDQMKEIVAFSGPATALWICGPLMSLIDTAIIGQGSSIELAALGPGTVLCDNMSFLFMFLSIATSNIVATTLARKDKKEVQHQISILLFIALTCGVLMLLFMKFLGAWALTAFTGPKNVHILPAANTYVQIRGLAWPAVLVGWVTQSASLGMKDSWGPLKALAVASTVNVIGHVVLCTYLGFGIAGAAWATMGSQIVAAFMMIEALNKKGYSGFSVEIPSPTELLQILKLAAPVFVTMASKVSFYSLIIYFATSMGTQTVAAHQVMLQMYNMCAVWGEPLSQTAQSFMPVLIYGADGSLEKAWRLLKSLLMIGALTGLVVSSIGTSIPWIFPNIFTPDGAVIREMHHVLIPFFIALVVTPSTHCLEGTLLAGRDLKFISLTMSGCFASGSLLLWFVSSRGFGLAGCWCALVVFQWARFFLSAGRLISPEGILYSEDRSHYQPQKLRAV